MKPTPILVPRPTYDALLRQYLNTSQVKVLSGVRRCGKSTLLYMLAKRLRDQGVPDTNLLYRKMDSFDVPLYPDAAWLQGIVQDALQRCNPNQPLYVFFDEIQDVNGWEKVIRRLHADRLADIYLTGSNASLLSSDLATYLSGRYVEIPVSPLSLQEYCAFAEAAGDSLSIDELFARYVRFGGMPGLFEKNDFSPTYVNTLLTSVHDTVILNDVAKRFELRDIDLLEKLVRYAYATSGNLFSSRKIAGALTSGGRKTTSATVDSYLNALQKAFLVEPCEQRGLGGKEVLQPQRKLYAPDTGLRNREIGFAAKDLGFQLENVVFCELRRRGWTVNVGDGKSGEVDFVAQRRDERLYVQVSSTVANDATLHRELSSLEAINDSFPKLLLTRDVLGQGTTDSGIRIVNLVDWLLNKA